MAVRTILALAAAQLASAHFGVTYPEWRGETLQDTNVTGYSQWDRPCAGVPYGEGNITDWPLDGGSLKLELHHDWTYLFVNLGLGANTTVFNITIPSTLWNVTGEGTFCLPKLALPAPVAEGTLATIQVVTVGDSGSALYNCADIRFSASATALATADCQNNGTTLVEVKDQTVNATASDPPSAAPGTHVSMFALSSVVGLTVAFVFGMSL